MDKILEGLMCSSLPARLKTALVKKVVEAAEKEVTEEQCQALFALSARFILQGEADDASSFQRTVGVRVLEAYARRHRPRFERFFTEDFLLGLLQQGYGDHLDRLDPAILAFIHRGLRLLAAGCPSSAAPLGAVFAVVRTEALRMACERPGPAFCARLCAVLSDFVACVPEGEAAVVFCQQLVRTIGRFRCPAGRREELEEYVGQVSAVGALLQNIWRAQTDTLLPTLREVFAVISSDVDDEPSIALASLAQRVPPQMTAVLVDSLTADRTVADAGFARALCRMVDWLSWPLGQHVDTWVVALLKGLAAARKFKILVDVTLFKVGLVFDRLAYPVVRRGALAVLSHMLLSFRHSPEAFHSVVPRVVPLVRALRTDDLPTGRTDGLPTGRTDGLPTGRTDGLPTSRTFLLQLTELLHCMMYQYSGFPELYERIEETIKDLPKPSEERIKLLLNQQPAWTSRSNSLAPGLLPRPAGRSETGRTGLVNLGNTCYMNSIIQSLFMATEFRRRVLSLRLNGTDILMTKLQLLFAFLAHTQRAAYAPRSFVEASRPPWFNAGSQQDCSEYLRFLLDRLHEEEKTQRGLEPAGRDAISCSDAMGKDPGTRSKDPGIRSNPVETKPAADDGRTLIETMFRGRLSTSIRCMQCNSVSEKNEPFTDLSLAFCPSRGGPRPEGPSEEPKKGLCHGAISGGSEAPEQDPAAKSPADGVHSAPATDNNRPPLSVADMVNYFLAPEMLEAENAYLCEQCGSLQRAEKAMRVVAAPEYLILTLVRFSYRAMSRKILDNVAVPPLLRLPVYSGGIMPSSSSSSSSPPLQGEIPAEKPKPSWKAEEEEENAVEECVGTAELTSGGGGGGGGGATVHSVPYVLNSVAMHSGMSSESGHYYSYGRNVSGADGAQRPTDGRNNFDLESESGNGQGAGLSACSPKQTGDRDGAQEEPGRDWLLFNDSRVTFTNFRLVQNVTERFPKDTAYVLLYWRQGEPAGRQGASPGHKGAPAGHKGALPGHQGAPPGRQGASPGRQVATGGGSTNEVTLSSAEPPLQKDLLDAISKDNKL